MDATSFARPHVALGVSPTMQTGAQPFQWLNSGSSLYVYTPGSYPNGYSFPSAAFIYKGLPPDNSYFGDHMMTLKVDGSASQTAKYQLFFNATASNWPGATPLPIGGDVPPNWYYYYNLIYPSGAEYHNSSSPSSTRYVPFIGYQTVICNDAHGPAPCYMYRIGTGGLIDQGGDIHVNGLHHFILICAHEATHRQYYQNGIDSGNNGQEIHNNPNAKTPAQDPTGDWDGDGLSNAWEIAHHLDPQNGDTAGYYASNIGDSELYANIGAWGVLSQHKNDWTLDWANDGLQWGNWFWNDPIANPPCVTILATTYHPWYFHDNTSNGPILTDPPNNILSAMP